MYEVSESLAGFEYFLKLKLFFESTFLKDSLTIRLVEDSLPGFRWGKNSQGALTLPQPKWGSLVVSLLKESATYMYPEPSPLTHNVVIHSKLQKD